MQAEHRHGALMRLHWFSREDNSAMALAGGEVVVLSSDRPGSVSSGSTTTL